MTTLILLGQIVAAHGIKGQVKIKVFASTPKGLTAYGNLVNEKQEIVSVTNLAVKSPTLVVASLYGITTRNQAELLKGTKLFISASQLPPPSDTEVHYEQMVGLPLIADGKTIGHVVGVFNFGAGSFCEVRSHNGKIGTIHLSSCTILEDRIECQEDHFLI